MNKKVQNFNFSIKDHKGNIIHIGDDICIEIEEYEYHSHNYECGDPTCLYRFAKKLYGKMTLRLSSGLGIVVKKVEYLDKDINPKHDDFFVEDGRWVLIRTTKNNWYKANTRRNKINILMK